MGLQGVVDINFRKNSPELESKESSICARQPIDEAYSDEILNSIIPFLVRGIIVNCV
jgi:hypothetical protein